MTKFDKSQLNFHGGYLTYTGDYEGRPVYENKPGVHPTRVGKGIDLFVARFKYSGPITKAIFVKELMKSFTVEEYAALSKDKSPVEILREKNPTWYENAIPKFKAKKGIA